MVATAVEFSYWMFAVLPDVRGGSGRKQIPAHHTLGMSYSYHTLGSLKIILFCQNHCESRVGITSIENDLFSIAFR